MINNKLLTIGYGNRRWEDFIAILKKYEVEILVDIRSIPYSKWQTRYNRNYLEKHLLSSANVQYLFQGENLGKKSRDISVGYIANDIQVKSVPFLKGIEFLEKGLESGARMAIMCCELDYKNCHRYSLVGEHLFQRGWEVVHIDKEGNPVPHQQGLL